jgi:hypothetical protein
VVMKHKALTLKLLACLILTSGIAFAQISINPIEQTPAYQNYLKRPRCEFSKLLYLVDRIKSAEDYKVIYNDREYEPGKMICIVRLYVTKSYKNEKAEKWVQTHAYRTQHGRLIYVREPSGKTRILKDLLLDELKVLSS